MTVTLGITESWDWGGVGDGDHGNKGKEGLLKRKNINCEGAC